MKTNVMHRNCKKKILPGRELNPGLPRDRRGYSPLYYRGSLNFSLINGTALGKPEYHHVVHTNATN